jgi:sugar lactone lactonase YvrE
MLEESTVEKVIAPPAAPEVLVEEAGKAPQNLCWDDRDESLWWSDVEGGRIQRLNLRTQIQSAIYEGPNVGAFIPQEDGTWLLFRDKDIALLAFDRHETVTPFMENIRFDGDHFTDAIADESGRVLLGTMRPGRPNGAGLYRLETNGTLAKLLGGTGQSAGRFRYDAKRGTVSNRQVFHECPPEEGAPTGLALDAEGTLWSARRDAGVILKIAGDRRLRGQVTFPARHVTSLTFGGKDHRTVFAAVTTDEGGSKIFAFQSPVPGLPVHRAKIERRAPTPI